MNILITEEQLKVIIREGRYSNPLFFKLANDLFDEFFDYVKDPSEENNFCELVRVVVQNPEIEKYEFNNENLKTEYNFRILNITEKKGLNNYLNLIDKDNKTLNSFIKKIHNNDLISYFRIDFGANENDNAVARNRFLDGKLRGFDIIMYRNPFITYEIKDKLRNNDLDNSTIFKIILNLKNKLVGIIVHELQHAYDGFTSKEAFQPDANKAKLSSDKNFRNFYEKTLKNDLLKIKFYDDPEDDEKAKNFVKYFFKKEEIWARIQQFFNAMNLEKPEHLIFFYKERISGSDIINNWAKSFVESVLTNREINKIKLYEKIEIPIDKFKRYLYKIFYQMLSYKVQLLIDNSHS